MNATASYPDILIEFFQDIQTKEILRFESQPSKELKCERKEGEKNTYRCIVRDASQKIFKFFHIRLHIEEFWRIVVDINDIDWHIHSCPSRLRKPLILSLHNQYVRTRGFIIQCFSCENFSCWRVYPETNNSDWILNRDHGCSLLLIYISYTSISKVLYLL